MSATIQQQQNKTTKQSYGKRSYLRARVREDSQINPLQSVGKRQARIIRDLKAKVIIVKFPRIVLREIQELKNQQIIKNNRTARFSVCEGIPDFFLARVRKLAERGYTDSALDILYDTVDGMLKNNKFNEIDSLLQDAPISELSIDILLGLLTTTLPAKNHLEKRNHFLKNVEASLKLRDLYSDDLLIGL